ncbi:Rhodanese-related sulfurtransferase [Albimonas donghaensis]|uniref:Rhodanese-related sulfurtransferase n=1 Tax=Albimonas donghaensis TaxID=356660 RepID=A0A1H2ZH57_9RHOB|nr:rhodanese-like domain-containing protein [Albimonas donghaensis]SDX16114.1 Rhodanese-related sulfurtransferase [Albimonas donghaensis]
MSDDEGSVDGVTTIAGIAQLSPQQAFEALSDGDAALVDVRTRAEWAFVGLPDLSPVGAQPVLVEWRRYPDMSPNSDFAAQLMDAFGDTLPGKLLFLCRSGGRSQEAALAVSRALAERGAQSACCNVAEGFEGDLDPSGQRGSINGWKVRGLPWRQS